MGLFDAIRTVFTKPASGPVPARSASAPPPTPKPIEVPEVEPRMLIEELNNGATPLLLDCREPWERQQTSIPDSRYIPMNQIPGRLDELDPGADIVVYCAHGYRSLAVAAYLIEQGFSARNLSGGIALWHLNGGKVVTGYDKTG